jgi:hypothetical protein
LLQRDDYRSSIKASKESFEEHISRLNYKNRFVCKSGEIKNIIWNSSDGDDRFVYCTAAFE